MSILSLPAGIIPNQIDFALKSNTQAFRSQLNGVNQTAALPGDYWSATMMFANRQGTEAHQLRAFLASLRGPAGRFYLTPYDHRIPAGTALGTPLVKGADQAGSALLIDGLTPNQSQYLLAGDYFQVGTELKMITTTAQVDSNGECTLHFVPPLRISPADNAAIVTTDPKCIMALADGNQARWQAQAGGNNGKIYAMSIACQEPLDL